MIKKFGVYWNMDHFIIDKYDNDTIKNEILEHIKQTNKIKPNSMHKYGHNLTNLDYVYIGGSNSTPSIESSTMKFITL